MKPRQLLGGLILFVFLTTIGMVLFVQDFSLLGIRSSSVYLLLRDDTPKIRSTATTNVVVGSAARSTHQSPLSSEIIFHAKSETLKSTPQKLESSSSTRSLLRSSPNKNRNWSSPILNMFHTFPVHKYTNSSVNKTAVPKPRPLECNKCFHSNFSVLLENPDICSPSAGTKPEMIMMITTSLNGYDYRQTIRETWASVTKANTAHIRHVFLLGTSSKETEVSSDIKGEHSRYKDLLVSDFVDSYHNLTHKTLAGIQWIVRHCGEVKFFLKTDQDMLIFPNKILDLARSKERVLKRSVGGKCFQVATPWRKPGTKYYTSFQAYPQRVYPGFCSGTGYVSTLGVAKTIVDTFPDIPFFHLEDVYLALVLRHVGYRLTRFPGFMEKASACDHAAQAKGILTIHGLNRKNLLQLWFHSPNCGGVRGRM